MSVNSVNAFEKTSLRSTCEYHNWLGFRYGVHFKGVLLNLIKAEFQNVGLCGMTDKEMDGFNFDPDP